MTYKTLKVGDHIKCFSRDEAETLIYILEIVLLLTNNMFCKVKNLGVPKYMSLVLKLIAIVYKGFGDF